MLDIALLEASESCHQANIEELYSNQEGGILIRVSSIRALAHSLYHEVDIFATFP